jgi:ferredoxin/DNA-binding MarR family transcriptional regulator
MNQCGDMIPNFFQEGTMAGSTPTSTLTDSQGRTWRTSKDRVEILADMMNEQSIHPLQTSDELFHIFDAALTPEEIEFLITMGGGNHTRDSLRKKVRLPEKDFERLLESLVYKGPIAVIRDEEGNRVYHIMTIYPGWFEFYMMRGVDDEEHREFARRIEKMYTAAYEFGNEEVINELVRDVGPHLTVTPAENRGVTKVDLNVELEKESHVYAAPSIRELFTNLPEDEFISVGHCLCRFEKELIGDHCRVGMPMETCVSIGPAAEHLIEQGICRQITKDQALEMITDWQDRGCIHQTGRTIPLKDFKSEYPVDIICNCCWDCCGVIGNYNRGYLPLTVTSHYRAEIIRENCTGCGLCVDYCPVKIISLDDDYVAAMDNSLCIGCGQCVHHCDYEAVVLHDDKRVVFLPMLGRDSAHIEPPAELLQQKDDSLDLDSPLSSNREEVMRTLEETREKLTRPELQKVFKKWNKTMQYHFTDLDEDWYFTITDGEPGPLTRGSIDKPDIEYILSGAVFVGLMKGTLDGFKAFRKKLVEVNAPVRDLIKLQKLIG